MTHILSGHGATLKGCWWKLFTPEFSNWVCERGELTKELVAILFRWWYLTRLKELCFQTKVKTFFANSFQLPIDVHLKKHEMNWNNKACSRCYPTSFEIFILNIEIRVHEKMFIWVIQTLASCCKSFYYSFRIFAVFITPWSYLVFPLEIRVIFSLFKNCAWSK